MTQRGEEHWVEHWIEEHKGTRALEHRRWGGDVGTNFVFLREGTETCVFETWPSKADRVTPGVGIASRRVWLVGSRATASARQRVSRCTRDSQPVHIGACPRYHNMCLICIPFMIMRMSKHSNIVFVCLHYFPKPIKDNLRHETVYAN